MPEPRALTLLAFDFGFKRIGVAVGDTVTASTSPCAAVRGDVRAAGSAGPDWEAIERQIRAVGPQRLVVGAPYNEDGGSTPMTAAARKFAKELALRFALPVSCVDERYSSLDAAAALKARRASGARKHRVTREAIDSVSAALILERWLAGEGRELEDLDTEQS